MIKESYPQTSCILYINYIIASSRMVAGDILGAVFEDESSSSGSDDEHGDDIYSYLGEPVLRCDDLEADSLAVYEPSALDDTCMGDMFASPRLSRSIITFTVTTVAISSAILCSIINSIGTIKVYNREGRHGNDRTHR